METTCDVLIVGGGLVGSSLACALDGHGLDVMLAEATPQRTAAPPSFDERNLALAAASINALSALGVWRHIASTPAPIRHIHVSSQGDFGTVRLDAQPRGLDRFGAVVVARELGAALEARLAELHALQHVRPARVTDVSSSDEGIEARLETPDGERRVRARLLVAADGTDSMLRTALGIDADVHDYAQTLFVSVVTAGKAPADTAYERFTSEGPMALLPLSGGRLGSVCTVPSTRAEEVAALDDDGYRELLQQGFGWRVGRFGRVGRRSAYPLRKVVAERLTAARAVLVGNAAQSLHPIGAQGFNLGLRDALTLAEVVASAYRDGRDIGGDDVLEQHVNRRLPDREETLALSHGLVQVFGNSFAPLRLLRSAGMVALDRVPGLNDRLVADAMGFGRDVSQLARGSKQ